jgi:hypothetical protein
MALLLFTPRSTMDANLLQHRLNNSGYKANWNTWTGAYEFHNDNEDSDQLEEDLSMSITYDINGYFETKNN